MENIEKALLSLITFISFECKALVVILNLITCNLFKEN